ncbi:mitogen-activated protein kinase kinase kinase 18 [Manihot esculenta]|uniref:mitogen-activated protein kinase kinase kinase n=1 Tax=Manihot esculenta TaxID=3983 RepID=A0A2C9UUE8_MANES|nr:mitogen-activated protein kinase kinase kinase 18 [Manihot esculenta]OAY35107.1 hypothetical protein MANES_12G072900v8 [Manihot esculenta]
MDWIRGPTLGRGSTATVSLGNSISGDVFAVKSAELDQFQFLQREQKILSSLSSPYVVGYKGCDITRENNKVMYNLFLEYIPGGTLADKVKAHGGRLEESVIGYYTGQIVQGLDYLHSNGWVHCDIKGRNVLIGETGAKLADFGCAKRVDAVEAATPIGGTPMFMAPEVARGEEQGCSSDIWALGCTIIEMANGGVVWPDVNDPVSVMYRIGFSDQLPEFPCCLSEQARDFLDKCLRRDPKQRWTANQLLKHPFLVKSNSNSHSHAKQIQESNSSSNSPTSILDQGFWSSLDESESENVDNLVHPSEESSAKERIRRLSLLSEGPSWDWDENWIPVRGNCSEDGDTMMDSVDAAGDVIRYGSVYLESHGGEQLLDDLLDTNIRSRISGDFLGVCKYGKDSSLIRSNVEFNKHKDTLLIPYIPRLILQA